MSGADQTTPRGCVCVLRGSDWYVDESGAAGSAQDAPGAEQHQAVGEGAGLPNKLAAADSRRANGHRHRRSPRDLLWFLNIWGARRAQRVQPDSPLHREEA